MAIGLRWDGALSFVTAKFLRKALGCFVKGVSFRTVIDPVMGSTTLRSGTFFVYKSLLPIQVNYTLTDG